MKKNIQKIVAASLAVVMAASGIGYAAFTNSEVSVNADVKSENEAESTIKQTIENSINISAEGVDKEETVYVISDANGNITKTIVSDWLKNKDGSETLTDKTDLKNIENVKTDAGYTTRDNNEITWNAKGEDIYYQGSSDKALPVDVKLTYYLDGKEISPKELAGQSGKVKIRFDYIAKAKQEVKINDKNVELYVPFTMISGFLLSNNNFSNIEVTNGKVINDGDRSIVLGIGFAGLGEDLNLSSILKDSQLEIPNYIEVTADVKDFSLLMTLTFGTADLLNAVNVDDTNTMQDLEKKIDELISAANQLKDGSNQLKNGATELKTSFVTYANGIQQLSDGIYALDSGASQLAEKSKEFVSGLDTALNGTNQILSALSGENGAVTGARQLSDGANQLAAGIGTAEDAKNQNNKTVSGAVSAIDSATEQLSGGSKTLAEAIGSSDYEEVLKDAAKKVPQTIAGAVLMVAKGSADLDQGLAQILAGFNDVTDKDGNVVQFGLVNGLKAVTTALGGTNSNIISKDAASGNPKTLQGGVLAVDSGMEQLQDGVSEMVANIEKSISDNKNKMTQIETALAYIKQSGIDPATKVAATADAIETYKTSYAALSGANTALQSVIDQMTAANLDENIQALKDGTASLKTGTAELAEVVSKLSDGALELKSGIQTAKDGSLQLAAGSGTLNTNMSQATKGAEELNKNLDLLSTGTNKLNAQMGTLISGSSELAVGAKTLSDGVQTLYIAVSAQLQPGLQQLYDGGVLLGSSLETLYSGTQTAVSGSSEIMNGTSKLSDGINKLADGSQTLSDGIDKFKQEGVDKITNALNGDIKTVTDRIKATIDVAKKYNIYSMSGENKTASVKFIYRTDEISK